MANERTWSAVAPQLLTADGGQLGQVQVADTAGFRVKAYAILSAPNLPDLQIQIKRVESKTKIYVGLTTHKFLS
jgi:ferredoxin-NADP reductase